MAACFYLTTPLYYVNARPHIGHAYTTIVADCFARWRRQQGEEVFFLTGTDEHGEKIHQAAAAQGMTPQAFADANSKIFRDLWKQLSISYDDFIRTTEERHRQAVQEALRRLEPQLTRGIYAFWYCVPCETNFGLREVDPAKKLCPQCARPVSQTEEEDYFLSLEQHRDWLRRHIEENPSFILPPGRRNEVLAMLEKELPALCVTRPKERVPWGIEVPFSASHVTYVWFDALLNYVSALGWPDGQKFKSHWRETGAVHLIGKDIARHHAVYWPILLHALGLELPRTIFAHGWWLVKGQKMSKSKGNIVDPAAVVEAYGLDPFRYFLLRDVRLGEDGIFSEGALVKRLHADLANDLGNLVYRTLTMLEKYRGGAIPQGGRTDGDLTEETLKAQNEMRAAFLDMAPSDALKALWNLIGWANHSIEKAAPWKLHRENKDGELDSFLYRSAQILKVTALFLWPFIPATAESIWRQLGYDSPIEKERLPKALEMPIPPGQGIRKGSPLFPMADYLTSG